MTQGKRWGGRRGTTEQGRARLGLRRAWLMGGMLALLATVAGGAQAAIETWDGGSPTDSNWTTDANWLDNTAPISGDDLVFPTVAARMTNNNDYPATVFFNSVSITSGGYTLAGNDLSSTVFGTAAPNTPLTISANFDSGTSNINFGFTGFPVLTKSGAGVLSLGGTTDNAFLSATVNEGTLILAKASSATIHALSRQTTGAPAGAPTNVLTIAAAAPAGTTAQLAGTGGDQIGGSPTANSSGIVLNSGTFDLNGRSESINVITSAADGVVTNTASSTTGTLSIGANNASTTLFFGVIKDTGTGKVAINKVGNATLILSNANNSYSGGTTLSAGTLSIGSDAVLGSATSNLTIATGTLTITADVTLAATRSVVLTGAATLNTGTAFSLTIPGVISGTGSIIKSTGTGTLTLSGANTFAGGTTLGAGILSINSDASLGAVPAAATTNLTFSASSTLATTADVTLATTRNIAITGTATFSTGIIVNAVPTGTNLSIPGVISGTGTFTKVGLGTLLLSGDNTFSGPTINFNGGTANNIVSNGIIRLASNTALGPDATVKTIDMGFSTGTSTSVVELTNNITVNNKNINVGGRTVAAANAQLRNLSGNNAFNGTISITNSGGGYPLDLAAGTLTLGGIIQNSAPGTSVRGLTFFGVGNALLSGTIQDNATNTGATTQLIHSGTGTLLVTGTNTYTGVTQVINSGVLQAATTTALGATSNLAVNNGGAFYFVTAAPPGGPSNLNLASLTLSPGTLGTGSRIGAGLGNSPTTSNRIVVTGATTVSGAVTVTAIGINGATPTSGSGPYTLVSAVSNLSNGSSYALATLNATNFTASLTPAPTPTAINVTVSSATPLTTAYWKGGLVTSAPNSWSASDGTKSNWTTDAAGTQQTALVPNSSTDVILSATGATNQANMVLGANMSIKSLTINDSSPIIGLNGVNSLTISPAGSTAPTGITVNSGAGAVTLNPVIILGSNQTWTNNSSNLMTVGGSITNGANLLTTAGTGDITFSSALGNGAGGLTKTDINTLTLANANTYTGATAVSAGILNIRTATGLGTTAGGTTVATGATLQLQGGITVGTEALTLNGAGATGQNGALANVGGISTYNGAITLGSSATVSIDSDSGRLTLPGNISGDTFNLTLNGVSGSVGFATGLIATTTGAVIKTGLGTWTLQRPNAIANSNTFTGGTTVLQGELVSQGTLSSPLSTGDITVANGARLSIVDKAGGVPSMPNNITLSGSGINGNGALNFFNSGFGTAGTGLTGNVTLAGDTTIRIDANTQTGPIAFVGPGTISGPGGLTLFNQTTSNTGSPRFSFGVANTYQGATNLTSSATGANTLLVDLAVADALPTATTVTFGGTPANATGDFNRNVTLRLNGISQTVGGLQTATGATGSYSVVGNSLTASTLVVNNATANTFGGFLGGTGTNQNNLALTKSGAGTLTLSGASTYTLATTISAGRLNIGDGTSGSITSPVTATGGILGGGTFNGTGTNISGSVDINSGATHSPGTSTAIQTINGAYNNAGTLQVELGGNSPGATTAGGVDGYDQVRAGGASNGNVTLSGTIQTILPNNSFTPQAGQPFVVLVNTGTGTTTVTSPAPFNYTLDSDVDYNPATNTITSMSGGNDVAIIPITTSVKLISFQSRSFSDGMWVEWKTGLETDNVGFWVWRQDRLIGRDGKPGGWSRAYRLNPALIAGAVLQNNRNADPSGGFGYGWIDTRPLPKSRQVRYWLQDVDTSGKATNHGPVKPVPAQGSLSPRQSSPMVNQLNGSK